MRVPRRKRFESPLETRLSCCAGSWARQKSGNGSPDNVGSLSSPGPCIEPLRTEKRSVCTDKFYGLTRASSCTEIRRQRDEGRGVVLAVGDLLPPAWRHPAPYIKGPPRKGDRGLCLRWTNRVVHGPLPDEGIEVTVNRMELRSRQVITTGMTNRSVLTIQNICYQTL